MNVFSADSFGALQKTLDGLNKRHEAISNNIANVDTPGYKRKTVSFRKELASALSGKQQLAVTNDKHIATSAKDVSSVTPQVDKIENTKVRKDRNNVSIDAEMSHLAKNTMEYQTVTNQLSNHFNLLDTAIKKGGQS